MANSFDSSRRNVFSVSMVGGIATLGALILLEYNHKHIFGWVYAAATNVLGVLFGLAVVSLIWEFFVRRSHSSDLRHYLRLGSSVAKSGLQDVSPRSKLNWDQLLESANRITVLTYGSDWLDRNAFLLRDLALERPLSVTVAVPTSGGSYLKREAEQRGVTEKALSDRLSEVVNRAAGLWREAKRNSEALHRGSKFSVVEHDFDSGYEIVTVDRTTIVTLAAPGDPEEFKDRVAFVYQQNSEEYPTNFFTAHLASLDSMNRLEEV